MSAPSLQHAAPWVGPDGQLPLPWLKTSLEQALAQRGHALLLHGPEGLGQFELGLVLAQSWLCEAPTASGHRPAAPVRLAVWCTPVRTRI